MTTHGTANGPTARAGLELAKKIAELEVLQDELIGKLKAIREAQTHATRSNPDPREQGALC